MMSKTAPYRERLAVLYKGLDEYMYDYEAYTSEDERDEEDDGDDEDDEEEDEDEWEDEEGEEDEDEEMMGDGDEDNDENEAEGKEEEEEDNEAMQVEQTKPKKKSKPKPEAFVSLLTQIISILREAIQALDVQNSSVSSTDTGSELKSLITEVDLTLGKAIAFAYRSEPYGLYYESHMPSFAHNNDLEVSSAPEGEGEKKKRAPLLEDSSKLDGEYEFAGSFLPHLDSFLRFFKDFIDPTKKIPEFKVPPGWNTSFRPHPLSSPCARFRDEAADIDPSSAWGLHLDPDDDLTTTHPLALSIFQARCEINSTDTATPCTDSLHLSRPSGDTLVLTSQGGYKNRVPYASFYHPNDATNAHNGGMRSRKIRLDLTSTVEEMALHEPSASGNGGGAEDTLLFVADWERIKSYRCLPANVGGEGTNRRVHTLASEGFNGPLGILPSSQPGGQGERVVRCGKEGKIAVWDLSTLPVHTMAASGPHPVIGRYIADDELNTWRDDPERIERSSGSLPTSFIQLSLGAEYGNAGIGVWHKHPSPSQPYTMLTGGGLNVSRKDEDENYFCHAFDLERADAGPVVRYLGHGGVVEGFSTSVGLDNTHTDGDPNVFLTWSGDGYVRLYDTRLILPVVTIAPSPGEQLFPVASAALAHPSGIPFVFTAGASTECIKVWDLRAQRSLYELATGNNAVCDLLWDGKNGTLIASTECEHEVRDAAYKVAKIPKVKVYAADAAHDRDAQDGEGGENEVEDEGEGGDGEGYESEDEFKCWPKRAVHQENYFGHVFDSGCHRIFQYKFKLDPDGTFLPHYGDAVATDVGFGFR